MIGMVPGLGSVSGLSSKEGFMSILSRNFVRLLMMGIFAVSVLGCFGDGEEKTPRSMEFELYFTLCRSFKQP